MQVCSKVYKHEREWQNVLFRLKYAFCLLTLLARQKNPPPLSWTMSIASVNMAAEFCKHGDGVQLGQCLILLLSF